MHPLHLLVRVDVFSLHPPLCFGVLLESGMSGLQTPLDLMMKVYGNRMREKVHLHRGTERWISNSQMMSV